MSVRPGSLPSQSSEEESSSGEETFSAPSEERAREDQMYERWEPIVLIRAAEFYEGLRRPEPNEFFRMTSTLVPCDEQFTYRFRVLLYGLMEDEMLHPLRWVTPGQVEITYIADGSEIRKETIGLVLSRHNRTGSVATLTDNIGEELSWQNFLLIRLTFNENTIKYLKPDSTSEEPEVVGELKIRHYRIYSSPKASLGRYFDDFGHVSSDQSDQEPSGSPEAAQSPGSSNGSSVEDRTQVLRTNPGVAADWFWGDIITCWEKIEFHCEMVWTSTGPLGYTINFLDVKGNVNDVRLALQLPETIQAAQIDYFTDQGCYKKEGPITLQVNRSGIINLTDLLENLDNQTWNTFIAIGFLFNPSTINYSYRFRGSRESGRATITTVQKIFFHFDFSFANIRGKVGENEFDPRLVDGPLPDPNVRNSAEP